MEQQIIYKITANDIELIIQKAFENSQQKLIEESFLNKFENVEVSTKTICDIWKISSTTAAAYIRNKVITPINPGSSKLLFSLKQILEMPNPKQQRRL
ncbi:MAG: hypothetical protein ACOYO1_18305 [Bacteroidales bacterium]